MTMRIRSTLLGAVIALATAPASTQTLSDPSLADMERLRPSSGVVVTIEFYNRNKDKVEHTALPTPHRPKAGAGASITVAGHPSIKLWGITPCSHDKTLDEVNFNGPCNTYIGHGLSKILASGPVVLCRAFADQRGRSVIDASCFMLTTYSSLYTVTKIEEFLISGGYAQLVRDAAGKALRPDLEDDERIAKGFGRGLWSFEHERIRREQRQ
jgi:endonuclease YncB( thermonuclease family)